MASPRYDQKAQRRHAKADLLLETARCYAFGTASESDVLEAAEEYGKLCQGGGADNITSMESRR